MLTDECQYFPRPPLDDKVNVDRSVVQVSVVVSSDYPVDLYIMSWAQLMNFTSGACGNYYGSKALFAAQGITSYSFVWTPPHPGDFYFVIYNLSSLATHVSLTISLVGSSTETLSSSVTLGTVQTTSSTLMTSLPRTQVGTSASWIQVALVIIFVVIGVSVYVVSHRKKPREGGTELYAGDRRWSDRPSTRLLDGTEIFGETSRKKQRD